jgi:hypothetical protein
MENLQLVSLQMQQLGSTTIRTYLESSKMSATTVDAPALPIQDTISALQSMAANLAAFPRSGHFMLFAKLPVELRVKIWRETLPGPRNVDVF